MISDFLIYEFINNKLDYYLMDSIKTIRDYNCKIYIDLNNYPLKVNDDHIDELMIRYMLELKD